MRQLIWVWFSWLGLSATQALARVSAPGHLECDVPLIVVTFLAMRKSASTVVVQAVVMGLLVDVAAMAPMGLHPEALALSAVAVYLASGHLAGAGALFFAGVTFLTFLFEQGVLRALLLWQGHPLQMTFEAGVWLLVNTLQTAFFAALFFGPASWLDQRMAPRDRRELSW